MERMSGHVLPLDGADAKGRHLPVGGGKAKGDAAGDDGLVLHVQPVDVGRGVGLGIAELLCRREHLPEVGALVNHPA